MLSFLPLAIQSVSIRLCHAALHRVHADPELSKTVIFRTRFTPYQLYPEAPKEGEDKYAWYKKSKHQDSEEKMKMYTTLMSSYGKAAGIDFKFGGTVANTLDAHRVIQHFQETQGEEVAGKIIDSLYRQYFEQEKHPSVEATLVQACVDAGIDEDQAKLFVQDKHEGTMDVKMAIREQTSNGVDSVPYIVFEGKRRDFTLIGAKEVEEYVKTMEMVAKECK
jgi:predicted DsbA family dithiol-disulfide isomerase